MATKKRSTAEEVFDDSFDNLAVMLELSCNSVASSAYAARLIGCQLMNTVIVKNSASQQEGTLYLLLHIGMKMRSEPERAKTIMDQFMAILAKDRVRNEKNRLSQIRLDGVSACTVLRPEYKRHKQKDANSSSYL